MNFNIAPHQSSAAPRPLVVPIRALGERHGDKIASHLLSLSERDRYLRFGMRASDDIIRGYVAGLDFERDELFGIFDEQLELIGMAHLAFSNADHRQASAEFGVSVLPVARGQGYGARMFERAARRARNEGVSRLFIHALSENTAMLKIARNAGATIDRDGSESDAMVMLPRATLDSYWTELFEEQVAQADYQIKVQSKQFRDILTAAVGPAPQLWGKARQEPK